jgi:predicted amidophosphoribosyltransferase
VPHAIVGGVRIAASIGLLLPGRCAACDTWGSSPLCERCSADVRWIAPPFCERCTSRSLPAGRGFGHAHAAAIYEGPAREALKAFKLLGERRAARWITRRMIHVARPLEGSVVTWVPSTRASEAARGFNPAEELARPLAHSLRLPARRLLAKRRDTLDSSGLSKEQRRVNLLDAFTARRAIAGHVLLVDDIFTTGATADECAKALRLAGAREVSVVTFARTP